MGNQVTNHRQKQKKCQQEKDKKEESWQDYSYGKSSSAAELTSKNIGMYGRDVTPYS